MKLTIELIPKGALGNNLRELLPQKDWDKLRELCYARANNRCSICGRENKQLHAHEVWDFDYVNKTQMCEKIKELREERKLKQKELSKKFNVRNTTISAWEQNIAEPPYETLKKICLQFDVSADYLLGLEDESGAKISENK